MWLYLFRHLAYVTTHNFKWFNTNSVAYFKWTCDGACVQMTVSFSTQLSIFNGNTNEAKQYSDNLSVYFVFLCKTVRDMPTPLHSYSIPSLFVQSAIQRRNINVSFFYKFFRNWSIEFSFNSVTVRNATDHRFPLNAPKVLWDLKLFSKSKPF